MTERQSTSPFYNKSEVLARGWTETSIKNFLGRPDRRGKNRKGRSGKVSLYFKDRVEAMEKTDRFKEWKVKSQARSDASTKAAQAKRQQTLDMVASRLDSVHLVDEVRGLSREELREKASASFLEIEARREQRSRGRYKAESITSRRTESFFDRIEVNWLRHEGTTYDDELDVYFRKTGVNQAKDMVRERIYTQIAQEYPHLENECERQLGVRRAKAARKNKGEDVTNRTASRKTVR